MNEIVVQGAPNILSIIAGNPNMDAVAIEKLLDVQLRWEARQAEIAFDVDMAKLEPLLPRISKTGSASAGKINYTYVKYEELDNSIRKLLREHNFRVSFDGEWTGSQYIFTATLNHKNGHKVCTSFPIAIDNSGGKQPVQATGSTLSYGRRYGVMMLLNLVAVDEDNDGANDEPISPEESVAIENEIKELKVDRAGFLVFMKVPDTVQIVRRDLNKAWNALNDRRRSLKK